jgi:hypothetical protein
MYCLCVLQAEELADLIVLPAVAKLVETLPPAAERYCLYCLCCLQAEELADYMPSTAAWVYE